MAIPWEELAFRNNFLGQYNYDIYQMLIPCNDWSERRERVNINLLTRQHSFCFNLLWIY